MSDYQHPAIVKFQDDARRLPEPEPGEAAAAEDEFPVSVLQITTILRAYWKVSVAVFAGVAVLTLLGLLVAPKSYSGVATMLVEFDSRDPLAAKSPAEFAPNNFLPTQIELMQSDAVLDGVINRLALNQVPEFAKGLKDNDPTQRDVILDRLRADLDVEPGRMGSQLVYITATASGAALAADIANAVADSFLEQHFTDTSGPSAERARRYGEELTSLKQKVVAAQKALTEFRKSAGADYLDSKTDLESDLLNSLEHRLLDTRNALRSNQARVGEAHGMTTSALTSTQISSLRDEGNKLEAALAQLRTVYGPNHPEVIALQSKIVANKAALVANQSVLMKATNSDIQVNNAEVDALERAVAAKRGKVAQIRAYKDQEVKFELEFQSAQTVYKKALDGYDQQTFAASGQNSQIRIGSRARVPVTASKPRVLKVFVFGLVGALLLALAVPFLLELPRRRIRCRDDILRDMKIPLLLEIAPLSNQRPSAGS
jgi:polysaccharide biosynthesis transport protein